MLGFLEIFALPILAAVAAIYGAREGKSCDFQNITMLGACFRGYLHAALATAVAGYLFVVCLAIYEATDRSGFSAMFEMLTYGIVGCSLVGLVISLIPAPIATFIAYNFGARKRAEEEIAKLDHERDKSLPSS